MTPNAILAGYQVQRLDKAHFTVTNPEGLEYNVSLNPGRCDCPNFMYACEGKGTTCKHIDMAMRLQKHEAEIAERYGVIFDQQVVTKCIEACCFRVEFLANGKVAIRPYPVRRNGSVPARLPELIDMKSRG